ncbi:hypothetical protein [Actinophytocola oryzae]|uniref:Uncharacterized protein n=1 Tax=Actinophytocola oryzae TaxID=502181 RepID=A0A4R7W4N9_9PSEU|nr:hypothetical protein [Actinophytocola oryzae]TDV56607.1 hypothetical protein CLV71_102674 [Actinophytocola oryzae]
MTGSDDAMTDTLTSAFRRHAGQAPPVDGLPEKVVVLARRRRRLRVTVAVAAIVVAAASIPVAFVASVRDTVPTATRPHPAWRWESYRGIEVQVPPDWGYGVPGRSWCAGTERGAPRPGAVGRPGPVQDVRCMPDYPPVDQRENWLVFGGNEAGVHRYDAGWVEETRRLHGGSVTVFTDDAALRRAILGSVRPIVGTDEHGCPVDHGVVGDQAGYRPTDGGLPRPETVESVSVCRYTLTSGSAFPLLSSGRLTGEAAGRVVAAIRSAPESDVTVAGDGAEIAVLRLHTDDDRTREVVVRYSDSTGNGFDDGTTRRELTADAIRPLLTGPNSPSQLSGAVAKLLGG